VREVYISIIM